MQFPWLISDTFKGIGNTHGIAQIKKTPIVIDDLRAMVSSFREDLTGKRDRALLLLGFTGAFRRSELVSLKIEDWFSKERELKFCFADRRQTRKEKGN